VATLPAVSIRRTATGHSCAFCGSHEVTWDHPLDPHLSSYRAYGQGHTLPSTWALCDSCEHLYVTGDDDAVVEVMRSSTWSWVEDADVALCLRTPLAVFRRADLGPHRFDPEHPTVSAAREQGFVPLRELTGAAHELGPLWPPAHSRWLDELGPTSGEDEYDEVLDRWLVRSPWPSLSVRQVVNALWRWVDPVSGSAGPGTERPEARRVAIVRFFASSEADVRAFLTDSDL
jgi:hypothetical protein